MTQSYHASGSAKAARGLLARQRPIALLIPLALGLGASTAEAQFGKLKKMGASAVKEAAKEKLGVDKKEPAKSASSTSSESGARGSAMPTLTEDKVALVVATLMPQVKVAEQLAAAAAARETYLERRKASDACMERAGKSFNPMTMSATVEKNQAKITALQKQSEATQKRLNAAHAAGDLRRQIFLQDTVTVLTERSAALTFGAACTFDFTPVAMLEERLASMQSTGVAAPNTGFDPGPAARDVMGRYEFGVLRERIALWAMLQDDPALKGIGKEGVFTAEEQAALTANATDIRKLAPLFKRNALTWKTWNDLREW